MLKSRFFAATAPMVCIALTAGLLYPNRTNAVTVAADDGVRVFPLAYFNEFAPDTALELINQTPGFRIRQQGGGRGLGDTGSNILIDGIRPLPKGKSLSSLLAELPARSVERLELIRVGARPDVDMQGYEQVVNVVTSADTRPYVEAKLRYRRQGTGDARMTNSDEGRLVLRGSGHYRGHALTAKLESDERRELSPFRFGAIDPGNPELTVSSSTQRTSNNLELETGGLFLLPGKGSLSIDVRYAERSNAGKPVTRATADIPASVERVVSDGNNNDSLLAAEYRRPFGGTLDAIAGVVHTRWNSSSRSLRRTDTLERSSLNEQTGGEAAVRFGLQWRPGIRLMLGAQVHGAYNFLEGQSRAFENGLELAGSGDAVRVSEPRAGAGIDWQWQAHRRLSLLGDLGLDTYETEANATTAGRGRDASGRLAAVWAFRPGTSLTIDAERSVGQLSFGQFLTSTSLTSGEVTRGASALEPPRAWIHSLRLDHRFADKGVFDLRLTRRTTDNPIELVPLSDTAVVPQNAVANTLDTLSSKLALPLDPLGFDGTFVDLTGSLSHSEAIDPTTGERRSMSGAAEHAWSIGLRKEPNATSFAWGIRLSQQQRNDSYAARSIGRQQGSPTLSGYIEWAPAASLRLKTSVSGATDSTSLTELYAANRTPGGMPAYISTTESQNDLALSGSLEWRPSEQFELTLTAASGRDSRSERSLQAVGGMPALPEVQTFPATPSVALEFRLTN